MIITCVAIFQYDDDGICVFVPDLPVCNTCGYSHDEAVEMAKEVVELALHGMHIDELPIFRRKEEFIPSLNQTLVDISINIENREGVLFSPKVINLNKNLGTV